MNFRTYTGLLLSLLLRILLPADGNGQVVVTAHVTAEVVESVSAAARVVTGFDLKNNPSKSGSFGTDLDMGTMTVHTGKDVSCNVVIKPAQVTDNQGNAFTIHPDLTTKKDSSSFTGTHTLRIKGRPHAPERISSGLYSGTYTMVFAYN